MKLVISSLTLLLVFLLGGCKKFLDRAPYEYMSTAAFYKTEKDIELAIYGSYATLRDIKNSVEFIFNENRSDNATYQYRVYNDAWVYPSLMIVDPGNTYIDQYWKHSYSLISRVNQIIANINVVQVETSRNQFEGEAKFLRAWAYFNLLRYFGDVPLVTVPLESGTVAAEKDRDPVSAIYEFIISELKEANKLMGGKLSPASDYGRVNKWTAAALLGKVLLTKGDKSAALPILRDLYENSGYTLTDNYPDLFVEANELSQASKEVLFPIRFQSGGTGTGSLLPTFAANDVFHGFGRNVTLYSNSLRNAFVHSSDTTLDSRYKVTCSDIPFQYEGPMSLNINARYPAKMVGLVKNQNGKYVSATLPVQNDAGNDYPEIRFAEVILMYAECETDPATRLALINEVRDRAGAPLFDQDDINNLFAGDYQEAILNERRLEFAFEGNRYFDLLRMGNKYIESRLLNFYQTEPSFDQTNFPELYQIVVQVINNGSKIEDWRYLLPLPRNQLVRSRVMKQNLGYTN